MVDFDDVTEKSQPLSSEKTSEFYVNPSELNYDNTPLDSNAISQLVVVNQAKLKRIFNYHVKSIHNRVEFSEFLKFCKSTQIFPNFLSIINLK